MRTGVVLVIFGWVFMALACGGATAKSSSSRVVGARWVHANLGLDIPVPPGWSVQNIRGNRVLVRDGSGGFRDNVSVLTLPHDGATLETLRDKTKQTLASLPRIALVHLAIASRSNTRVLVAEFVGVLPKQSRPLHILSVTYIHGEKQVVTTAVIAKSRWEQLKSTITGMFEKIAITL